MSIWWWLPVVAGVALFLTGALRHYALARSLAQEGAGVLVASSELDELYVNCDRIWVMHEGRNAVCFDPLNASRDEIDQAILIGKRV